MKIFSFRKPLFYTKKQLNCQPFHSYNHSPPALVIKRLFLALEKNPVKKRITFSNQTNSYLNSPAPFDDLQTIIYAQFPFLGNGAFPSIIYQAPMKTHGKMAGSANGLFLNFGMIIAAAAIAVGLVFAASIWTGQGMPVFVGLMIATAS
jgi:hypothetical protein